MFWTFNFSANPDVPCVYNVHNFPLNFRSLDIQFFCKSRNSVQKCTQFPIEFSQIGHSMFLQSQTFRTYNVHNFPLNFCKSRYAIFLSILPFRTYNIYNFSLNFRKSRHSIFLQIQTFRACNVHNFPLSLHSSRQSIFLQIQTFCTNIMYTIFCRIYAILDVQFFCKSKHSVHVLYTISN